MILGVKNSDDVSANLSDSSDLDNCLAQTDLNKLAAIGGNVPSSHPPFYNCFMNQFVNSPTFNKRLA
jgi:hypothetical protein